MSPSPKTSTQLRLLRKLLPLSLSDVAMTLGDPLQTMAIGRLPGTQQNLAALGIVKAIAVFLESPIIMMLHASTSLSRSEKSREALKRFMLFFAIFLSVLFALPAVIPSLYDWLFTDVFGATMELADRARFAYLLMVIWPLAIAWRRFHQGILIRAGESKLVARASFLRIGWLVVSLAAGVWLSLKGTEVSGATLGAIAMAGGVVIEAGLATFYAKDRVDLGVIESPSASVLPKDVKSVGRYYFPLASTMIFVWGGRAALLGVVARAVDGTLSLAAWPAAWGFVLVVANSTRMVQQLVISGEDVSDRDLLRFAASVGAFCSLLLLGLGFTVPGEKLLAALLGADNEALVASCLSVVKICTPIPFLVCLQNAMQGFMVREHRNDRIQFATLISIGVMLLGAGAGISAGLPGAFTAAWAMVIATLLDLAVLGWLLRPSGQNS